MHARLAEALARIGAAVLVGVSENHHAARLATLVEHADDHVPVAAHGDVSRQSSAVGKTVAQKPSGNLIDLSHPPLAAFPESRQATAAANAIARSEVGERSIATPERCRKC